MPSSDVATISRRLRTMDLSRLRMVLGGLPTVLKYLVIFVFLLNIRSWPLGWHIRIWRPAVWLRVRHWFINLRSSIYSKDKSQKIEDKWFESVAQLGGNPLDFTSHYKTWASVDESDFNGHLSNSSYPKTLDAARFKAAIEMFPMLFRETGWIPLAGTHFHFIREIPILASYEVRSRIAAWDSKWFYIIHRFVSKPKKGGPPKKRIEQAPHPTVLPSLRTVSGPEEISANGTPFDSTPETSTKATLKSVSNLIAAEEPDGATLHTIAVSHLCFKVGRITIPPSIVFAFNGLTGHESGSNPPPHWDKVRELTAKEAGGSRKKMAEFLKGGWRNVPECERWWEQAFADIAERNAANLKEVEQLKKGIEGARQVGVHTA
ncbi:hypothetical protein EST38_g6813 [Candolleomyces aberdarensis]|uniref:Uncharacterized protein n=1 Tax=Candolleomyces aberdarensis TaxID=2316362 RepID=A0A4Q2DH89_9AGAR|nr:hypothetical protein EST38_g6813 [Candolleomyces aberdarensis]